MPVTDRELTRAVRRGKFRPTTLNDSHFSAAEWEGSAIPADNWGPVAEIEIGEDNILASTLGLIVGQNPTQGAQTAQAKPQVDFDSDNSGTDIADNTQYRLSVRKSNGETRAITEERLEANDNLDTQGVDLASIEPMYPSRPVAKEGRYLVIELHNPSSDVTFDLTGSSFRFPIQKWDD